MNFSIENEGKVYETKEDVEPLLKYLTPRTRTINLCGNVFHPEALEHFLKNITKNRIRSLNIMRIFSTFHSESIAKCLNIISTYINPLDLHELDMSENALSCNFTEEFINFLKKLKNLRVLCIRDCGLGPIGGEKLAEILDSIENKTNLEQIEISNNKLSTSGARLGEALSKFPNLESIKIAANGIQKDDIEKIISNFAEHTLRVFDITDNFLSKSGCKLLGSLYSDWEIEELHIGDCLMRDDGFEQFVSGALDKIKFKPIVGGFDEERRLLLDISYNEITQQSMKRLIEFVENENLISISIEGNEFEDLSNLRVALEKQNAKLIGNIEKVHYENVENEELISQIRDL
ncbi:Ran GTPase-activating protein 1 [Dictyocoela muelleri]|nr:Ran GTPase-activating protein 1 [Dictyocoela muelleri]